MGFKKKNHFTKKLTTFSTCVSLFASGLVPVANAQQQQGHIVNDINALITGFGQQYVDMVRQNNAQILAAKQLQSLSPKVTPSILFPNCPLPQASTNFPEGVCEPIVSMDAQSMTSFQQATSYKALALTYKGFFEQMGSLAQNTRSPVGIQCLEDSKKNVDATLKAKQNALQDAIDILNKQAQDFRDKNNASLDQMYELNQELNGINATKGSSRQLASIDQKNKDFLKFFGEQCQNIIGSKNILNAKNAGGLIGLKDTFQLRNIEAQNFVSNSAHIEKEVNNSIQKMKADIDKYGVDPFLEGKTTLSEDEIGKFGGAAEVFKQKITHYKINKDNIKSKISTALPNFEFPQLDKDFEKNFDRFRRNVVSFDKSKFINDCVTLNNQGYGLNTEQVLSLIRIPGLTNTGNSLDYYRDHLSQILDSSTSPEEKLRQIQNINNSGVTMTYDNNGKQVTTTPYDYYRHIYSTCETLYSQDDTFNINNDSQNINNTSNSEKVASVQSYLDELLKIQRGFKEDLTQAIFQRVMNCDGKGVQTTTCSSENQGLFNTQEASFCVAHAKGCSYDINNCFKQAETRVNERVQTLKQKQNLYNAEVIKHINTQDAILKNLRLQVNADSEYIKNFFPGATYAFPEDMFVTMPEESMSDFGVMLRGGGKADFALELPEKIAKLKKQLEEQSKKVDDVIGSYINEQKKALDDNKKKWSKLEEQCKRTESDYRNAVAKANEAQAAQQQEEDAAVGDFCRRFDRLKNLNPAAGCDGANSPEALYEDMSRVSSRLDPSVEHRINQYAQLCSQSQNERTKGTESESAAPASSTINIADICSGGSERAADILKEKIFKNLTKEDREKAEAYLKGDEPNIPSALVSTAEGNALKILRENGGAESAGSITKAEDYLRSRKSGSVSADIVKSSLETGLTSLGATADGGSFNCNGLTGDENKNKKDACDQILAWHQNIDDGTIASIATKLNAAEPSAGTADLFVYNALKSSLGSIMSGVPSSTTVSNLEKMSPEFKNSYDNSDTGFCGGFKRQAAIAALDSCESNSAATVTKCFKDEFEKTYTNGSLRPMNNLSRSIASVERATSDNTWSRLGEQSEEESCEAQANNGRSGFGSFLQNFDATILQGLQGTTRK